MSKLVGRLVDLKRAYKQLRRAPEQADLVIFALEDEHDQTWFFEGSAVGFGARNAVFGFNTHARGIKHVACVSLSIPVNHFFDDFTQIEPPVSPRITRGICTD